MIIGEGPLPPMEHDQGGPLHPQSMTTEEGPLPPMKYGQGDPPTPTVYGQGDLLTPMAHDQGGNWSSGCLNFMPHIELPQR